MNRFERRVRMRKLVVFVFLLFVIYTINGCSLKSGEEEIFTFKDSYVGDNSAVVRIVNQLEASEYFKNIELKTKEEPYGILLNYDWFDSEEIYEKTAIHNATFLFALVQNAEWITFNFNDHKYEITREDLQNWYGKNVNGFQSEDELVTFVQLYLDDEDKINQFFQ